MRIQIYRCTRPGLELVTEYYQWRYQLTPEEEQLEVRPRAAMWIACPGCGARKNKYRLHEHHCAGTLTPDPVEPHRVHTTVEAKTLRLQEYLAKHPDAVASDLRLRYNHNTQNRRRNARISSTINTNTRDDRDSTS